MTFEEAYGFLKASEQYGSVLGLESMRILLDRLDNPQNCLKFVHVAGTNGKGSTAAYLANILAAAGFRVGRYISPSVFSYFEKIQISWTDNTVKDNTAVHTDYIKEAEVTEYIERISKACSAMMEVGLPHPTVFEIETAMAMLHFVNSRCDMVVLEVGLGGRLDATNVITTTVCSVITSISMDHMHILGNTLEEIAAEKAGIIKPGIPVISYEQDEKAEEVIKETCKNNNSVLTIADFNKILVKEQNITGTVFSYEKLENVTIKLLGKNQVKNAVVAVLTITALQALGYSISERDIRNGLLSTRWSGRFEVVKDKPLFIIDGAHNEAAAISLAENIKIYFPHRRLLFIMGVLADKDYVAVLKHTAPYADRIYTITPGNVRGLSSKVLAKAAEKYCRQVIDAGTVSGAVSQAYQAAGEEDVIIAFGSLSYLEEVSALIAEGVNYGSEEN